MGITKNVTIGGSLTTTGDTKITSTTSSSSPTTGALVVGGGIGIGGGNATSSYISGNLYIIGSGKTTLFESGGLYFDNNSTILDTTHLLTSNVNITGTTASSSTTTGALTVAGGAGIVGNLFVGALGGNTSGSAVGAGYVGELKTSSVTSANQVTLMNSQTVDITTLLLTAGNWLVWGNVWATSNGFINYFYVWVSTSSASLPDRSLCNGMVISNQPSQLGSNATMINVNVSSAKTVYLSAYATLGSGSSNGGCGNLYALRIT